ncbi:hypothetical protein [Flammeovirga pacifica]|uniref:Small multi-drug export protein n=1 Tax=Flammeovirga pacifica TaxID=915059 RepID=A0A1S1Z4W9_FLAPC|nr:hypothetical protein [Flammeovirga pacifica]OHX68281.1 hypothetical protein NH26_18975 [Flammeovirga pacifica]
MELITKYISLLLTSAIKFLFGPIVGFSAGLSIVETIILTVFGMMLTVVSLTYAGTEARKKIMLWLNKGKDKKLFTKRNRLIVNIWQKYGMMGVAFFTPCLFGPPIGMLIALSFGAKKRKIITYMFMSAVFWAIVMNVAIYYFGDYLSFILETETPSNN